VQRNPAPTDDAIDEREGPTFPRVAVDESAKTDGATSVGKAVALLTAFDRPGAIGVSELARRAALPKSTAYRLLGILEEWDLVERVGRRYRLGAKLFELGNRVAYCLPRSLRDVAHPFLTDLYELTHETVHLAVLDGGDVLYLEKLYGHNPVRSPSYVGGRVPAYCTGLGKAMLAYSDENALRSMLSRRLPLRTPHTVVLPRLLLDQLRDARTTGLAYDREEVSIGLACVAAPILGRNGTPIAAVSVSGPTSRFRPEDYAAAVRKVAAAIHARVDFSATPAADVDLAAGINLAASS
jgi:DNA-binding IclR family transcriptional regulator